MVVVAVVALPVVGAVAGGVAAGSGTLAVVGAGIGAGAKAVGGAVIAGALTGIGTSMVTKSMIPDDFYLPMFNISPQEIFANRIPLLDVNFISPNQYIYYSYDDNGNLVSAPALNSQGEEYVSIAQELQPTISKWYTALRNMVLVGLMVVLLYIGIRIVISSTSKEAAKYKENLQNWIVAVLIVVFMHYIMAFALTITEEFTSILNSANAEIVVPISTELISVQQINQSGGSSNIQDNAQQMPNSDVASDSDNDSSGSTVTQDEVVNSELAQDLQEIQAQGASSDYVGWRTNFMGEARILQQLQVDDKGNGLVNEQRVGYTIIYFVLVIYTIMFLVIYIKRVIYMAFLTLIAPLVALTYPIDKMSDGKAQAFDMWIKEYTFNLLIQPFHLLLYTILIGSAMDLATNNMLYAIVALGFLLEAEKLLRRFFGFEKAQTTGKIMGGAVGGAMIMQGLNSLRRLSGGSGHKGGAAKSEEENAEILKYKSPYKKNADSLYKEGFGTESASNLPIPELGADGGESVTPGVPTGSEENGSDETNSTGQGTILGAGARAGNSTGTTIPIVNSSGEVISNVTPGNNEESQANSMVNRLNNRVPGNDRILDKDSFFYHRNDYEGAANRDRARMQELEAQNLTGTDEYRNLANSFYRNNAFAIKQREDREAQRQRYQRERRAARIGRVKGIAKTTGKYALKAGTKGLRMAGKIYGGLTYGAIGAMAGLATDDFSNVATYGATGAGLGYAAGARGLLVGTGLSSAATAGTGILGTAATTAGAYTVGSAVDNPESISNFSNSTATAFQNMQDNYAEAYYGGKDTDEYKNYKKRQYDMEFMANKKLQDLYKQNFGDGWKEHMEVGLEYVKNGVQSHDKIISVMKNQEKNDKDIRSKESIALARAADTVKNESDLEYMQKRWRANRIPESKIQEISGNIRLINKW